MIKSGLEKMTWILLLFYIVVCSQKHFSGVAAAESSSEQLIYPDEYDTEQSANGEISLYDVRYRDPEIPNLFDSYEYLTLKPDVTRQEPINRDQPYLENKIELKIDNQNQILEAWSKNTGAYVIQAYITGAFSCFGLVGNILALVILHKDKNKLPLVYILIVLAVCDWLVSITMISRVVVPAFCRYNGNRECLSQYSGEVKFSLWVIGSVLQTIDIWLIVCVSIDRFIAICLPFKFITICTRKNIVRATVVICVFSVVFNIPLVFYNFKMHDTMVPESELNGNMSELSRITSKALQTESSLDYSGFDTYDKEPENGFNNDYMRDNEERRNKRGDQLEIRGLIIEDIRGGGHSSFSSEADIQSGEHSEQSACAEVQPCSQICVDVPSSYECSCFSGYLLNDDGRTCNKGGWFVYEGSGNLGQNPLYRYIYLVGCNWMFCFILPSLILMYVNPRLMCEINKSRRTPHGMQTKRDKQNLSVTVNIVAIVTLFLLCQTPTFVSTVIMKGDVRDDREAIEYLVALANLGRAINSSVNIVLYLMFYKKFRKITMEMLCCVRQMQPHHI